MVLNAGLFRPNTEGVEKTEDGVETTLHVNYYSHFLLLQLLKGEGVSMSRVVSTSSALHKRGRISDVLEGSHESNTVAYGTSKRAQILHMQEEARQSSGTVFASYTPGFCATSIFEPFRAQHPIAMVLFELCLKYFVSRSSWEGAQSAFHILLDPAVVNGGYYSNCMQIPAGTDALPVPDTPTACQDLWQRSVSVVGLAGRA